MVVVMAKKSIDQKRSRNNNSKRNHKWCKLFLLHCGMSFQIAFSKPFCQLVFDLTHI